MSEPTSLDDATPDQPAGAAADARMNRADLAAAIVFIVLGAAVLYGSFTMDRLEIRRINPLTAPGLVPGMLSIALIICGILLATRSARAAVPGGWRLLGMALASPAALRALVVLVLALVYTLGLVGRVPFWAATGTFVFAFVLTFEVWLSDVRRTFLRSLPWAAGLAIVTAAAVTLVFERGFLVRLP